MLCHIFKKAFVWLNFIRYTDPIVRTFRGENVCDVMSRGSEQHFRSLDLILYVFGAFFLTMHCINVRLEEGREERSPQNVEPDCKRSCRSIFLKDFPFSPGTRTMIRIEGSCRSIFLLCRLRDQINRKCEQVLRNQPTVNAECWGPNQPR